MSERQSAIRVLVVDDHLVVRQGMATMLHVFPDIQQIGEADSGEAAIQRCDELNPDVVLMDLIMPGMGGIEAIRLIHKKHADIQIIAITSFTGDKQLVQAATEAGAIGYIFKDVSIHDLANTIRTVYQGIPALSPVATRLLIQSKAQRTLEDFKLSDRETEILELMAEGITNQEIAERLSISISTAKFHISSVLRKLGASSRTEAVKLAYQHKLVGGNT
jgi:two-component system, NarL family, response regulator LiaR